MSNGHTEIILRESRAVSAFVVVCLFTLDVMIMTLGSVGLITAQNPTLLTKSKVLLAVCAIMLLAVVGKQILYIIKMVFPSSLVLTDEGAHNIGLFRNFSLLWENYNEAKMRMKMSPRGGRSYYIRLEPKNAGNLLEIFRDGYTASGDDVFRCVKEAQSGRLIDPITPFPYGIILGWIPSFIGVSGFLVWKFEPVLSAALSVVTR